MSKQKYRVSVWNSGAHWKNQKPEEVLVTEGEIFEFEDQFYSFRIDGPVSGNPEAAAAEELIRKILEALCRKDEISLDSEADPGTPARNYELALRLGIGQVFGLQP
jgi:hypothetical protein